ncbi:MAG: transcriptional regulator NrdR [Oscillospiraceae bacterium]|nr:transcriptional regulator NrdR [Oscillospiraceae bacterium]
MRCPFCGFEDTRVTDSRPVEGKIRRKRECGGCGKRFTTYESATVPELLVCKKDNTFERFSRNKLLQSMSIAVKKRPVSVSDLNRIADDIEAYCSINAISQITSSQIGDMVLDSLKNLDRTAYVRFAAVYYESPEVTDLRVLKKDGTYEYFSRTKIIQSMYSAVKKRPVSIRDMNRIIDGITQRCFDDRMTEITTSQIGDAVLEALKELDPVAYVRFASVYKEFSDVDSFIDIISELKTSEK